MTYVQSRYICCGPLVIDILVLCGLRGLGDLSSLSCRNCGQRCSDTGRLSLALLHLVERDGLVLGLLRLDVLDPGVPDRAEEDRRDRCRAASAEESGWSGESGKRREGVVLTG